MTLTIALTPEVETQLQAEATRQGLPVSDYLETLLRERFAAQLMPGRSLSWRDIRGAAPANSLGEDAQSWVTRTRREADERRSRHLVQEQMKRGTL